MVADVEALIAAGTTLGCAAETVMDHLAAGTTEAVGITDAELHIVEYSAVEEINVKPMMHAKNESRR